MLTHVSRCERGWKGYGVALYVTLGGGIPVSIYARYAHNCVTLLISARKT